nr:hypothetical protein CFP56_34282 [Quercus suber]
MVHQFFSPDDALAIMSIPLSSRLPRDRLVWTYTPKGNFTIRSTYKVTLSLATTSLGEASSNRNSKNLCKTIWGLNVPNKIKSLLGGRARTYYLQSPICAEEKFWIIQLVKLAMRRRRAMDIVYGAILRPMKSRLYPVSRLSVKVVFSMSLETFFGIKNLDSVWMMNCWG